MSASRRSFYYIPASGEPVKIVQSIEQFKLDSLPGRKLVFRGWQELHAQLREVLGTASKKTKSRVAMQYSPMNDIPYISRVDAGTIELVRSFGVEPVTSAELVQRFEAVFSPAQHEMHVETSDKCIASFRMRFPEIARRMRANEPTTEWTSRSSCSVAAAKRNAAGADDVAGTRMPPTALHADKGKKLTDQARQSVLIDAATKLKQTQCSRD